jgi:Protein of unknown function (DUF3467)
MPDIPEIERVVTEQPITTTELRTVRSSDFRTIYANNSGFSTNPFDMAFTLNEVTQDENGQVFIEQKARVIMPPLHAKLFAMILTHNVKSFETQFGEIKVPQNIKPSAEPKAAPAHVPTPK